MNKLSLLGVTFDRLNQSNNGTFVENVAKSSEKTATVIALTEIYLTIDFVSLVLPAPNIAISNGENTNNRNK